MKMIRRRVAFNRVVPIHNSGDFTSKIRLHDPFRLGVDNKASEKEIQMGKGFLTKLLPKNAIKRVINEVISGSIPTVAKNIASLIDKSPNKTKQLVGEKHVPLYFGNKKIGFANYMGPGTHLMDRLQRKVQPRSFADRVSQRHDIDYALSKNPSDIRKADNRMIASLKRGQRERKDTNWNIGVGLAGIQGKKLVEDIGLLRKDAFLSKPKNHQILLDKREELEQSGFGPGDLLKQKIIRSLRKIKSNKRSQAKKGKGLRTAGSGLGVAGGALRLAGGRKHKKGGALRLAGGGIRLAGGSILPRKRLEQICDMRFRKLKGGRFRVSGEVMKLAIKFLPKIVKALAKEGVNIVMPSPLKVAAILKKSFKMPFDLEREIKKEKRKIAKQKGGFVFTVASVTALFLAGTAFAGLITGGIIASRALIKMVADGIRAAKGHPENLIGKGLSNAIAIDFIKNTPQGKFVSAAVKLLKRIK